jgi:copper transport protein
MRRTLRTATLAAAALAVGIVGFASPAAAHAELVTSEPADAAALVAAPPAARVMFSEAVSPDLLDVSLHAGTAEVAIPLGESYLEAGGMTLVVPLPELANDVYRLSFSVRDPVDLHETAGSVVFGVGRVPELASTTTEPFPSPVDLAIRWISRGALVALLGSVIVLFRATSEDAGDGPFTAMVRRRAWRAACAAAIAAGGAELAMLVSEATRIGWQQVPWRALLLSSVFGRRLLVVVELSIGVAILARWSRRSTGSLRSSQRVLLVLGAGMALALGWSGHAAVGGSVATGVALHVAHLLAAGVWVGGLAVGLVVTHGASAADRHRFWRYLSGPFLVAALATVGTGVLMTGREAASVTALAVTSFGQAVLVKVALTAIVLCLGARHALKIRRASVLPTDRSLRVEAVAGLLVTGAGAFLTLAVPAVGERFEPRAAPPPTSAAVDADDLTVTLDIRPNRPGLNLVSATVLDTRRPSPGLVEHISLRFVDTTGASISAAAPVVDGRAELGTLELERPGDVNIEVAVERPAARVAPVGLRWLVAAPPVEVPATVISDTPLLPATRIVGLTLLGASGALLVGGRLRRRRHGSTKMHSPGQSSAAPKTSSSSSSGTTASAAAPPAMRGRPEWSRTYESPSMSTKRVGHLSSHSPSPVHRS